MMTTQYPRVHRVNRPLEVGETLLVPVVYSIRKEIFPSGHRVDVPEGGPVLWPPHRDRADGQPDPHYHLDRRFLPHPGGYVIAGGIYCPSPASMSLRHAVLGQQLRWVPMYVFRSQVPEEERTPVAMIENAIKEVKCNALVNGKCPHRGFNMAQVLPDAHGVKTCPMHGMRFCARTGRGLPYRRGEAEGAVPRGYSEEDMWLNG